MGDDIFSALNDPVRRALYDYVVAQGREVGRAEAAEAVGVQRTLAAHHLDRLAEAGLLDTATRRLGDRRGPGAGRPAKVYARSRTEHAVSLPPRDYRTLALVLAEVVETVGAEERAEEAARRVGERLARDTPVPGSERGPSGVEAVLAARGYEPYDEDGVVRLRNCPFHAAAEDRPVLVCSVNLALLQGVVRECGDARVPVMDPRPGECCVAIQASKNNEH
ncbi:helix-turn-helix transcriptional regulator [Bailinhaonella thermotolerans]|uniref:helix-turn-helix transcriptional regulator n=1 Tax=Bailinhaonella thermotolerans TaxID=1070861 RepID=UPI001F5B4363|nr:helix-turn-helix domain-containing protein [Bailinhaonella thermotolerans]